MDIKFLMALNDFKISFFNIKINFSNLRVSSTD